MAACGFSGSIVLTKTGGVWTCGKEQHVGTHADDDLYHCIPAQYFHDKKIVMVTSGDHHMLSIDTEGMLWAWGDNRYGQLCCGALDEGEGETEPVLVPPATFDGSKVAYVEASSESTMVVTVEGVLWVCGFGMCGQLGTGTNKNALIPTRVGGSDRFGGEGVRMIACSNKHSLILGTDNRVWACGKACHFALGMVDTVDMLEPTLLPDVAKFTNGNVVTVAAGKKHSVFVMQDGTVYTCGRAMNQSHSGFESPGGLGHLDFEGANVVTPHALSLALFGGARIGHWHACSWLLTHEQESLAFIMGLHSRLGVGCAHSIMPPELIQHLLKYHMQFTPTPHKGLLALMGLYPRELQCVLKKSVQVGLSCVGCGT
jgi:alpha-tubulin suppressor-like RCC1 family protein